MTTRRSVDLVINLINYYRSFHRAGDRIHRVVDNFRQVLDPDRDHRYWRVTEPFWWSGNASDRRAYAFLVKRMDGNVPSAPTGHEWFICMSVGRRDSFDRYARKYWLFGTTAGNARAYFMRAGDASITADYELEGGFFVRYYNTNKREIDLTGASWAATGPFTLNERIESGAKAARVTWIDPLDVTGKHIRVLMIEGDNFVATENLTGVDSGEVLQNISIGYEDAPNTLELTGTSWLVGGSSYDLGEVIRVGADREATITWIDPNDNLHIRCHMDAGQRFRNGDDLVGDNAGEVMTDITINKWYIHDFGFLDNDIGTMTETSSVSVRNITGTFVVGELITFTSGAIAQFDGWHATEPDRMLLSELWGKPELGDSVDAAGSGASAKVYSNTCYMGANDPGAPGFTIGERIYTDIASCYIVKYEASSEDYRLMIRWGRQDIVASTYGGSASIGDRVQNTSGSRTGWIVNKDETVPGQITWTVCWDSAAFIPGEDVFVVGTPTTYLYGIAVQNQVEGYGKFYVDDTIIGEESGETVALRTDDFNFYFYPQELQTSPYSDIFNFFPIGSGLDSTAERGIVCDTLNWSSSFFDRTDTPEERWVYPAHFLFDWNDKFMCRYVGWGNSHLVMRAFLSGEIIEPLNSNDPWKDGVLCMFFDSGDGGNYIGHNGYRLEARYPFLSGGGLVATWSIDYKDIFGEGNGIRPNGEWDWDKFYLLNTDEGKGFIKYKIMRSIGATNSLTQIHFMFRDYTDVDAVGQRIWKYGTWPWLPNKAPLPLVDWGKPEHEYIIFHQRW